VLTPNAASWAASVNDAQSRTGAHGSTPNADFDRSSGEYALFSNTERLQGRSMGAEPAAR
jgi:hypothetical protein